MKVSKRDILLLLGFIGILAGVCSYFFVFKPYTEKTQALIAENNKLQGQIKSLQGISDNKEIYESEIDRMSKEIDDIYQVFPVDVREEDCILMAINQEIISPMTLSSISINQVIDVDFTVDTAYNADREYTYDLGEGDILGDGGGNTAADTTAPAANNSTGTYGMLRDRQTTYNYTVSYEGLKRSIKHIGDQTNRVAIESLTASFDNSTGLLIGSTTLNMYIVPYQEDKVYVQPNFSAVLLGTDNIFGTIVINSEANMPEVEDMDEETGDGTVAQ